MRIRTLEITGFKSFPERTVLAFDRGISAIVGPNGCGKSNLIDALRWVMGEQNPRQLRGRSMEDMIFSGTERQAAVGMAEVVLSLDNSEGLAPPPYKGFAEIQIARRLYRSGESEYRINKTPCRLRDVVDFFLDTGVGTRGYTIVEQGHIADLVSTRPQDRRTIFEQAAGIGKYRQRRRETEGKLRSTEQNLLRITDVIGELRRQIASLDRQARKANRYKQIKARLRDLELIEAREEHRAETAQFEAAERDIERQRAEGAELDARVGRAEAELEEARRTQLEREKQLQALSERLYSLRTVIQSLESRIDYESRERQGLAAQAAERDDEIARLEQQLVGRGAELTEKIAEMSEVEKLLSADSEALAQREAELRDGSEKLSVVQGRREALQVRLADLGSERATLSSRLESLGERRHELELRLRQSEEALETSTLQVEGLEREEAELELGLHRALAERDDLGRRLSQELREQQQARASHQAGREELEGLRDRLKQAQTQLASLREMGEREAQRASALLERLPQEARGAIDGLLPEVLQVDDGLETAVEAVLGGRLEALLVGDAGAALRLTALLREDSLGRATIVPLGGGESGPEPGPAPLGRPLASFVRARGRRGALVERLLRDAYLVEDLTEAVERFGVGSPPATFVTRAGEVLDRSGAITGGLGAPPGALSRAREIRRLEADLPNLERSVRERAERIQEWAGRVASLETEIENTRSRRHTVELAVLNLEKDLERMRERGKEALQSAQGYREGRELTQSQLQRLEGDDRGIRTRLQEIESEQSRALANRDELSAEISSRGRELELLEQRLVQSRVELAQLGGRRDQIRQSREQLQAAVEDDRQWIGRWREEVRTARERAESLERSEQEARQELGERIADEERERSGQTELRSDFESGAERSREYEREVSAASAA
ncbi:MAG: chromosome segregation protein SMC, partial [Proteobacteria bacterium]|nr:chromosome segregation protein SMC [Pseudomonadota bacterium]